MSRPTNTAERREQITSALLRVMARKGYEGASIAEVAAEAGLAPGLLHYHFHSKLEILLSLFDEMIDRQSGRLEKRLAEAGADSSSQVDAFLDCHLAVGPDRDPEALACWIAMNGEALRQAEVRARLEAAVTQMAGRLRGIVEQGVEDGVFACGDPAAAAGALLAAIQGYYMLAATARAIIPRGSAAPSARRMAAGLLGHRLPERKR